MPGTGVQIDGLYEVYSKSAAQASTGHLIGGGLVLTSYHGVHGRDAPRAPVEVRKYADDASSEEWVPATVVWPPSAPDIDDDPTSDVALLKVEGWVPSGPLSPVAWWDVTGSDPLDCSAVGFPVCETRPDKVRDTFQLVGTVQPLHGLRSGLLTVFTTGPVPRQVRRTDRNDRSVMVSGWQGMSGSSLFHGSALLGVLVTDHSVTLQADTLQAVPLRRCLELSGFSETLRAAGVSLRREITAVPPPADPSLPSWLFPLPTVPPAGFVGRDAELRTAVSLADIGHVIPVTGPEKAGKTSFVERLLTEDALHRALHGNGPVALLRLDVPGCGSKYPVSRALTNRLDATLLTYEDYGEDNESTARKIGYALNQFSNTVGPRDLVTVIDCDKFGEETEDLEADLDDVLANTGFRKSVVLVSGPTELRADGRQQLLRMPPVRLGPLSEGEAARLLAAELSRRLIAVDADDAIGQANDSTVRRPGILRLGASQHLHRYTDFTEPRRADTVEVALDLLDACRVAVSTAFEEAGCRLLEPSGAPGRLAPFMVWSLTGDLPLPRQVLVDAGVDAGSLERLARLDVLDGQEGSASPQYALSRSAREALRNLVRLPTLDDAHRRGAKKEERTALGPALGDPALLDVALSQAAHKLFDKAFSHAADQEEGDATRRSLLFEVECAFGWLGKHLPRRLPQLARRLEHLANSIDMEALVLPVQPSEDPADEAPLPRGAETDAPYERLYRTVSELNVRMRAPVTQLNESRFVSACEEAAEALHACVPGLPSQLLRSMDSALFFGQRRLHCAEDVLRIRAGLVPLLAEDCRRPEQGRVGRTAWTVSWLLNTADLQVDAEQAEQGGQTLELVRELMETLPEPNTLGGEAVHLGLRIRIARLGARMTDDAGRRLAFLEEAVRLSRSGLERCAPTAGLRQLWTVRYLEAARNCAYEMRSDEERIAMNRTVHEVLTAHYGPHPGWTMETCLQTARFMRALYRRQADPALRLDGAQEVVALLEGHKEVALQQAAAHDARGLLELARACGFKASALWENDQRRPAVAEARTAERYASRAVRDAPGAAAYGTWLTCLRRREQWEVRVAKEAQGRLPALRRAVAQTRQWLSTQDSRSSSHARLARLCIEEEWHQQGRSLRAAVAEANGGSPVVSVTQLRQIYLKRVKMLDGHEKRFGLTIGTLLLHAEVEREYRRLLAVHDHETRRQGRPVDNGPTWAVLQRAAGRWPHSNRIRLAKAQLHRYLWEYEASIEALEAVILSARDGHERRRAQITVVEVLLQWTRFGALDGAERAAALARAAGHLAEPLGHRYRPKHVTVLRERLALESGAPVDWTRTNAMFEELFSESYARRIGVYLQSERRHLTESADGDTPAADPAVPSLSTLLYENFTDLDLISGLGQLYLRQADLLSEAAATGGDAARQEAVEAARRAYDCFDACRVLQTARDASEWSVNRFRRADAIRRAALLSGTVDPFPWPPETKPSWLKLAVDLYQSAAGRSVGPFYVLCSQQAGATHRLLSRFGRRS